MTDSHEVICAGIIVADHVCSPIDHLPAAGELVMADQLLLTLGGCAANTAVDLAKMGVSCGAVGCVGDDQVGVLVRDMLHDAHVETKNLRFVPEVDTSQTLIVNVVGQDRRFIHTFGANAHMRASNIPLNELDGCKILYLGGFLLMKGVTGAELARVFAQARTRGVQTFLDVVTPPGVEYRQELQPVLPQTDVFHCNTDEARIITGETDTLRQAQFFHELGAKTAVVTRGSDGAVLVSEKLRLKAGVYPVEYVDASGGGDAFDAGYIFGLLNGMSTEDCLRYASALGASCVRAIGTTPGVFTRAECDEFMGKNTLTIDRI